MEDEGGFTQSIHVFLDHTDIGKATAANSPRKVDRKNGVGKTFEFQKAFNLDGERAADDILFFVEVETSSKLPADGASSDPGSVRSREREVLEGNQGRSYGCGRTVGASIGVSSSSPNVMSSDNSGEGVGIRLREESRIKSSIAGCSWVNFTTAVTRGNWGCLSCRLAKAGLIAC